MAETSGHSSSSRKKAPADPRTARLRAELKAPYRGLRQVTYLVFGASAAIGAFVFVLKLFAGEAVETNLANLGLQIGVLALMVGLFRLEARPKKPPKGLE